MSIDKRGVGKDGIAIYRVRYRDPDGRWRAKTVRGLKETQNFESKMREQVNNGTWVDLSNTITLTEYAKQWAASRPHRKSTAKRVDLNISKHIEGTPLGNLAMAKIRPSQVQAWATGRSEVLAPGTLKLLVGMVRSIFNSALLDRVVNSNPVTPRLSLPKGTKERIVPLTVIQVAQLSEKLPKALQAAVITQAGLGLRIAELLALRVQDVNFLKREVTVVDQLTQWTRERAVPKTTLSRRTVPLPKVVGDALAAHLSQFPAVDGYLFTLHGKPYLQNTFSVILKRAVKGAGLPIKTTSHDLRHHYASVLLAAGESVIAVAERLGHENATLVLKVYGHLLPDSEDRTRKAVDDAWNEAGSSDKSRTETGGKAGDLGI